MSSAAQAAEAISNCYYPSETGVSGTRGYGYGGCNRDGLMFSEYAAAANELVVIGVQLEHKDAFVPETLEAILSVDGLRFTQDGPYDHSGSHLVPGKMDDPRVVEELKRYREACARKEIPAGKHVVRPTAVSVRAAVADGYGFIALGTDLMHVMDGASTALRAVEAATGAGSGGGESAT